MPILDPTAVENRTQYSTILAQVKRNLGNKDDADIEANILSAFNAAQRMLAWAHDWPELQMDGEGVLSIDVYSYSTSILEMVRFRMLKDFLLLPSGEAGIHLRYISPLKWRGEIAPRKPVDSTDKPRLYTIWGKNIYIHPTPNVAYACSFWYHQYPISIVEANDYVQYEDATDTLIYLATAFTLLAYEEVELASIWIKRATDWMRSYGIAHKIVGSIEAAFSEPKGSILNSEYWKDPFAKEMP